MRRLSERRPIWLGNRKLRGVAEVVLFTKTLGSQAATGCIDKRHQWVVRRVCDLS